MFREVMSHMDLSIYAEVPLIIFLGVFIAVTIRVLRTPRDRNAACARIPLEDGVVTGKEDRP